MDVSNSTGDSTGYRVLGSGGVPPWITPKDTGDKRGKKDKPKPNPVEPPKLLHKGTLRPNTYVRLEVPDLYSVCTVEFHPKGKQPITLEIKKGGFQEVLVSLLPNGEGVPKAVLHRRKA